MATGSIPIFSMNYLFDPRPRLPFQIVAKRYWTGELCPDEDGQDTFSNTREDVRTLIFIHAAACHKEHWEPTIQRLFEHEQRNSRASVRFHDMWALDMPNHGDSALLNEEALRWGYDIFSWEDHARCIHAFLAGLGTGVDVDFSKRRLSLVGHSMGGTSLVLMPTYYPLLNISSLHLFEPYMVGEKGLNWSAPFIKLIMERDDIWPSVGAAYQELRKGRWFHNWDERCLRILVTHGLRPLPTADYPDLTEGVTLKCTKKQQAAIFRDFRSMGIGYRSLSQVLKQIPTHIVYGAVMDTLPYEMRHDVLHVASGGISNFASASTIPGAGHLVLGTHPDLVADYLWKQLNPTHETTHVDGTVMARL